jgi:lysophospholipase L1-like esterase
MPLWLKRSLIATGVLALVLIGAIAILETVLRAGFAEEVNEAARQHPPHPFLQVMASSLVAVNRHGFRGDPIEQHKAPRTFRIFTLGGSTTLGIGTPSYEDSYPFKLQTMLRQRYPDVTIEVQNAGNAWYTTAHLLINYQMLVRPFEPDLIVVFEAINDLYRSFSPPWWAVGEFKPDYSHYLGPYIRFLGPAVGPRASASRWSVSDLLVWRRLREDLLGEPSPYRFDARNFERLRTRLRARTVTTFRSLDSYRNYYGLLIRNIQADRRTMVMASQPYIYSEALPPEVRDSLFFAHVFCAENGFYPTMESMMSAMRTFNNAAEALANAKDVPFLDFERAVPKTRAYFSDDVHLTAAGNEVLARMVFDWIVGHSLVAARSPSRSEGATAHFSKTMQPSSPAR